MVSLRPVRDEDLDVLLAIIRSPGVAPWWPEDEGDADELRAGEVIEVDGELAGWLGVTEEDTPNYRHAGLDLFLAEPFQGRGHGPEALAIAAQRLFAAGHHRLTIDPAVANERAVRAYASVGFRPVGVMRAHERGPDGRWRDSLL